MLRILAFAMLLSVYWNTAAAQVVYVYDYAVQRFVDTIPTPSYDTTLQLDYTTHREGALSGKAVLDLQTPTAHRYPGTPHTYPQVAHRLFNITDYPIRTAVKLHAYKADTLVHLCSGLLVGDRWVLTAAHCVYFPWSAPTHWDSLLATPAFDEGRGVLHLSSKVRRHYSFYLNGGSLLDYDVALLELDVPLGDQVGWVSMAYHRADSFYQNNTFHKLSYPVRGGHPRDSALYNGDTLYYCYGALDFFPSATAMGVRGYRAGGGGQSGSSLFYTDNQRRYWSMGVFSVFTNYQHHRLTPDGFYGFQQIMDRSTSIAALPTALPLRCYPNPAGQVLVVDAPAANGATVQLYDALGRWVHRETLAGDGPHTVQLRQLPAGSYFVVLQTPQQVYTGRVIKRGDH